MKSFKTFLLESKVIDIEFFGGNMPIFVNPRTPQEVFKKINPDVRAEVLGVAAHPVYKFIYDVFKDKLYVWWYGDNAHTEIKMEFNIPMAFSRRGLKKKFGQGKELKNSLFGYLHLSKKQMEIAFNDDWTKDEVKTIMKNSSGGNFGIFAKKFKVDVNIGYNNSKFGHFL